MCGQVVCELLCVGTSCDKLCVDKVCVDKRATKTSPVP